jgi:uncharacterized coiled-coil DUF342 family protein
MREKAAMAELAAATRREYRAQIAGLNRQRDELIAAIKALRERAEFAERQVRDLARERDRERRRADEAEIIARSFGVAGDG